MIVVVLVIALYWKSSQNSSWSDIEKAKELEGILGRSLRVETEQAVGDNEYKTDSAYFRYPIALLTHEKSDEVLIKTQNEIENFEVRKSNPSVSLVFQIFRSSSIANLDEVTGVVFRRSDKDKYLESHEKIDGERMLVFRNGGNGMEIVGFSLHKNKIFSFAVTGSDKDEVEKIFEELVSSFQFRS